MDSQAFSKAWNRYWKASLKDWQKNQPILIAAGNDQNISTINTSGAFNRDFRPSPESSVEERPSLKFSAGELRGLSADFFLQNVPPRTYDKILKTRAKLEDHYLEVDIESARIKDRNPQPFS